MKIAHIVVYFPSLSETFTLNQITGLIDLGHEVEIFALWDPKCQPIHEDVIKYNLLSKTNYLYKTDNNWKLGLIALKSMLFWLGKDPVGTIKNLLDLRKTTKFSSSIGRIFLVMAPFINKKFDVIHAHFAAEPADFALIVSKFTGTPFIVTTHAYDIFIKPDLKELKTKFDHAAVVITISKFNKNYLLKLLGEEYDRKIYILHCGVNLRLFIPPVSKHRVEKITIINVANLLKIKGHQFAIKAVAEVKKNYPMLEMKIIGFGPLESEIKLLISRLGLEDSVTMLGALTQAAIVEEMKKADIFILPSITDTTGSPEGVPVALMEAQAMKLPVVSTRYSGIPELVIDGETGFLVPEKDVMALADKIKILIEHPELRNKMGWAGRKHVEKEYNIDILNRKLERVLESAVNKPHNFPGV